MIRLLYGNEPFAIDRKVKEASREVSAMSFAKFEGFSIDVEEFAGQYPLCDPKFVLVVYIEELKNDERLLSFIKQGHETCDILFIASKVDERCTLFKAFKELKMIEVCNKVSNDFLAKSVCSIVQKEQGKITQDALNLFVQQCGYQSSEDVNFYTVRNLVKQLLFASDDKIITSELVKGIVVEPIDNKIFTLTGYLLKRQLDNLFKLAKSLIDEKESPIAMLSLLLRSFRLAYKATLYSDKSEKELTVLLGVPVYQFKDAMTYSSEQINQALDIIQSSVNEIKSGAAGSEICFYKALGNLVECLKA